MSIWNFANIWFFMTEIFIYDALKNKWDRKFTINKSPPYLALYSINEENENIC